MSDPVPNVYISGPYSSDPVDGVRNAVAAADEVLKHGGLPFVPHLTHLWHLISPKPWEEWIAMDLLWVRQCHILVRLPGESKGADLEVAEFCDGARCGYICCLVEDIESTIHNWRADHA